MPVLAKGALSERPWGRAFAALASRHFTGELRVVAAERTYIVGFEQGAVIAAWSPLATDSAARIALTAGLINSSHATQLSRTPRSMTDDEVAMLTQVAGLSDEVAARLRRRVIAMQAIRTFALVSGEFEIDTTPTLPSVPVSAIDVRALVLLGARTYLGEPALRAALGAGLLTLRADALESLAQYGLSAAAAPVVRALQQGISVEDLVVIGGAEPNEALAIAYAFAVCDALHVEPRPSPQIAEPPPTKPRPAPRRRASTGRLAVTVPTDGKSTVALRELLAVRAPLLQGDINHFSLLGVLPGASFADIRKAYFSLAKLLHPDRLIAAGFVDADRTAHRVFAAINEAFRVLSSPTERAEFERILAAGGAAAARAKDAAAAAEVRRIMTAETHFRRGEQALGRGDSHTALRELTEAARLAPDEPEHHGLLAWAKYADSSEKDQLAAATRSALEKAVAKAPQSVALALYLGRFERMTGNLAAAQKHFRAVLAISPNHGDAASELRLLESRAKRNTGDR